MNRLRCCFLCGDGSELLDNRLECHHGEHQTTSERQYIERNAVVPEGSFPDRAAAASARQEKMMAQ